MSGIDNMGKMFAKSIDVINKHKEENKTVTVEDRIEFNKTYFNLTHGKGKRKKHKGKKKRR